MCSFVQEKYRTHKPETNELGYIEELPGDTVKKVWEWEEGSRIREKKPLSD